MPGTPTEGRTYDLPPATKRSLAVSIKRITTSPLRIKFSKETLMKFKNRSILASFLTVLFVGQATMAHFPALGQSASDAERIARLEVLLENLRQELKIPAYSAAIVKDQKVIWAKGFGYADLENKIPATEHTPYHLAHSPRLLVRQS